MQFFKRYKIGFAIFFLAVAVRLIFFFVCLSANGGDVITTVRGQDWYFEISRNLILGNGFSAETTPPFTPYSYGVPGYPYFLFFLLWLTGSYAATSMIQLLLSAAIPLIGMRIARLIVPSDVEFKHAPLAVGILLALAPYQILHSFIFFTETLFTALLGIFLITFLNFLKNPSTRLVVLAGLFLGLATLVKPTVQYVPILVVIFVLWRFCGEWRKKLFAQLGYFLLMFFLVLSPWLYRNYKVFDTVNLSAQVSFNLYVTLLPSVLAIENHSSFTEEQGKLPPVAQDALFGAGESTLTKILRHPVALIKLATLSAFTFFTHDGMLTFLQSAGVTPSVYLGQPAIILALSDPLLFAKTMWAYMHTNMVVILFARLFWVAVAFFFGVGLYHLFCRRIFTPQMLFAVALVLYFMLTTMINGLTVNARFRMPVEPIIFAVAVIGFTPVYKRIKNFSYGKS
ncbi:MAG: hypothetical protein UY07_C0003G0011 [Parcubacteria group bacterium GW2011_GWA1_47_8]|nr:MAG: hypothetical protein UY07_C0003G0011 [Parcubacteria group bacterium GW2011_GWA1_47_8]